jgi:small subunit ribosomal protein S21
MLIVKVKKGNIEGAIKKLRSKVRNTKQLIKLRKEREYTKPSVKKRLKKQKAVYIQKLRDQEQH